MEESSSNCGGGDEDDVRSSEWEVVSLSLSSHSLSASTTFETAAGTGQEEIGGEAVDVGLQSDYSFLSSSSSSSHEIQQTVPSSDDDDDDDGESLMVQFDLDSDKKRIPLGSSSSPELPPPKGLSQEQVALAAATTDDDELRPESDYVKEEHFSHVSSCTSHMQEELLQGLGMQLLITVMSMRLETRAFPMHLLQRQKLGCSWILDGQEEDHCLDLLACQLHLLYP